MALEYFLKKYSFDSESGMYVPYTRRHNVLDKEDFIKRLKGKGTSLKETELRGSLDLIIDTLEDVLCQGSDVNIDGFMRFSAKVKGKFKSPDEKYHRSRHCIKINTVISKHFNKKINENVYVKKIDEPSNKPLIRSVTSYPGKMRHMSHDYPNHIYGKRIKYFSRELTGINIIDKQNANNIFFIPVDELIIIKNTGTSLDFNFNRNTVFPSWLTNDMPVLTALVYRNIKTNDNDVSNYYETVFME